MSAATGRALRRTPVFPIHSLELPKAKGTRDSTPSIFLVHPSIVHAQRLVLLSRSSTAGPLRFCWRTKKKGFYYSARDMRLGMSVQDLFTSNPEISHSRGSSK